MSAPSWTWRSPRRRPSSSRSRWRRTRAPRSPNHCRSCWTARRFRSSRASGRSPVSTATGSTCSTSPSGQPQGQLLGHRRSVQAEPAPLRDIDLSTYLRPSRYAEADKFFGFAATEFGEFADSATLLEKVSSWVGTRLDYVPGSSDPIDGAADTLLAGCRGVPRLRAPGHRAAARGERAGAAGRRCTRRAASRWTSTRWPRRSSTASGGWSTRPVWRRGSRWCASRPGAMPPTPHVLDNHKGAITLNNMTVDRDRGRRSAGGLDRPVGVDPVDGYSPALRFFFAARRSWKMRTAPTATVSRPPATAAKRIATPAAGSSASPGTRIRRTRCSAR